MKLTTMTQVTVDGVMQGNGGASDENRGRTIAATLTERVRPGIKAAEALHFLFELSHQA